MMRFCQQCATPMEQRPFEGKLRPTCTSCGFIAFADPKVAATVLIGRDNKLLFIRRAIDPGRGLWCFPGGYVDFGEDPMAAAMRECHEETGLDVEDVRLLDVGFDGRVIVITYTASVNHSCVATPGDDADRADWFAADALPPLAFKSMERPIEIWRNRESRTKNQG